MIVLIFPIVSFSLKRKVRLIFEDRGGPPQPGGDEEEEVFVFSLTFFE